MFGQNLTLVVLQLINTITRLFLLHSCMKIGGALVSMIDSIDAGFLVESKAFDTSPVAQVTDGVFLLVL